ncbi:MAG: hypothetical protein GY859_33150, partial [Desulfobacterales bacterium]|nr:hypothetical protein [Desulfobacterales bacterium]
ASETTARLSASAEQVRGISMETHIMALNAIVKAAHLGERGLALEVLAQEVKKLSNQSNAFTVDVNDLLASITGSSLQLKERSFTTTDDGSAKKGAGASLDEGVGEITRAYTKFKEDSSEVSQRAESLTDRISRTRSGLEFLPALADKLTELRAQLNGVGRALSPWAGQAGEAFDDEAEKLADKYTMDQERVVHGQLIRQAPGDEFTPAPGRRLLDPGAREDVMLFDSPGDGGAASGDDLEGVDFFDSPGDEGATAGDDLEGVELFDSPGDEGATAGDDLEGVELFDSPGDEGTAAGDDLEGVELFDSPGDEGAASGDDLDGVEFFDSPGDEGAASGDDLEGVELFDSPGDEGAASGDDMGDVEFFDSPGDEGATSDDELEGVELFDSPADEGAASGEDLGDVEFFDSPADASAGKPDQGKNEKDDLGDNVELF